MKVIILAGGYGTRLPEYTDVMPKPMVRIGGIPILIHIIKSYLKFNFNNFYVALGYKSDVVKKYFKNFKNYDEKYYWQDMNLQIGEFDVYNLLKTATSFK